MDYLLHCFLDCRLVLRCIFLGDYANNPDIVLDYSDASKKNTLQTIGNRGTIVVTFFMR